MGFSLKSFFVESSIINVLQLHEKCPYLEFFCSVFSGIWTEYSVRIRENMDQKNYEYGHFCTVFISQWKELYCFHY